MYTKSDILEIAGRIYEEAGKKERMIERIQNYKLVPKPVEDVNNYYYLDKDVYEYNDLNATLGQAAIFLGSDGESAIEAGKNYVEIVHELADIGFLIEYVLCDFSFDAYLMSLYIHSWLLMKENKDFSKICTDKQLETIENWFYDRGKRMWEDRDKNLWVSFRPYDNQDIGVGICALTAAVVKEKDPVLAKNLEDLSDKRVMGWAEKNGNPDDTLFYNPAYVLSLYFYSVYRQKEDLFKLDNCRTTFETMLQLQSGTGMTTNYNWTQYASAPMMMTLGAYLLKDSRYKWMAEKMLQERLEKRLDRQRYAIRNITDETLENEFPKPGNDLIRGLVKTEIEMTKQNRYDHIWEGLMDTVFHLWLFWDDELEATEPTEGSLLLKKTAGNGRWGYEPEPILPEKAVLRDGWGDDNFFVLMNLWGQRNSPNSPVTAHRYPGANELTSLIFGEPFVVPNNNQTTRDVGLRRQHINAFNILRNEQWVNPIFQQRLTDNDLPQTRFMANSKLQFFKEGSLADGVKSTLFNYFGWTNERTVLLCKDRYVVVFDHAEGAISETVGVCWHLQGEMTISSPSVYNSMRLRLMDKVMNVFFPHREDWYSVELKRNTHNVPIYQHHAEWELNLIGTGNRMGFITVFDPEKNGNQQLATLVTVKAYGNEAHPEGLGVRIGNDLIGSRMSLYQAEYDYEDIKTDAEAFLLRKEENKLEVEIFNGCLVRLPLSAYTKVEMNEKLEAKAKVYLHEDVLYIRFDDLSSGNITIYTA